VKNLAVKMQPQVAAPKPRILLQRAAVVLPGAQTTVNRWLTGLVVGGVVSVMAYMALHMAYALVDNSMVVSRLLVQKQAWQKVHTHKVIENAELDRALRQAQSPEGLEAMARNKLHLVGQQEILVRLH
jgi:cell division protein FtsB